MVAGLSERQRQLLDLVRERIERDGQVPSLAELGRWLGGISPAAVHLQLAALARKGYLRWPRGRPREVELLLPPQRVPAAGAWRIPIVGTIAAGAPIEALQAPDGYALVEAAPLRSRAPADPAGLFALRVRGDSMVDACIQNDDVVVVRRQDTAEDGDTVVALLDGGQATLKQFYRDADGIRLKPANRYYPDIVVKEVRIQGRVMGVLRYC